jgi:two-component system KDP operon response regulator KdpE
MNRSTSARVTPREWDLLAALVRGGEGRVMTHRQLLTAVWGPAQAEEAQYLRVYVGHLRQKLGPLGRLIRTEPGVGYRFGEAD